MGWLGSGASTTLTVAGGAAFAGAAWAGDRTPCTNPKVAANIPTASAAIVRVALRTGFPLTSISYENWAGI